MAHYGNYYPSFVTSIPYSHYPGYGPAKTGYEEYLPENKHQYQHRNQSQYQPRSYPTSYTTNPYNTTTICYSTHYPVNFCHTRSGPTGTEY